MENRCICCGEITPEGAMVCGVCERKNKLPPCMDKDGNRCTARTVGCHSECKMYKDYKAVHAYLMAKKQAYNRQLNDYRGYQENKCASLMRKNIAQGRKKR